MDIAVQLPRIFQANADRFYRQVILPTLEQLCRDTALVTDKALSLDEFLDQCAKQIENHTANEECKAFSLTLDGIFERQLSQWVTAYGEKCEGRNNLLAASARIGSIDLGTLGLEHGLRELHLVANIVRHGEGRSCLELRAIAPSLWHIEPSVDTIPAGFTPASEEMVILKADLQRYASTIVRFWGYLDQLPMAVIHPPY